MAVAGGNELVSLIGGRLALDFANAGSPRRRLSWEELISFLEATKVISAERTAVLLELPESEPMTAHALLEHASSFRDVLRQAFRGMLHKEIPKPDAVEAINELLRVTEGHDELRSESGRWRIEFVARESGLEGCWQRSHGRPLRSWPRAECTDSGVRQFRVRIVFL